MMRSLRILDGYIAKFFKKCWQVIKDDIYEVVLAYFDGKASLSSWNCTTITLILKVPHASRMKEY